MMTSLTLLLWIALGISLQVIAFLGIAFWRHWQNYLALRSGTVLSVAASSSAEIAGKRPASAWQGFRNFRVERRAIEDAGATICSFYLVPEDGQPLPSYLPGQFLTFELEVPLAGDQTGNIIRCYSLSDAPKPNSYRVSIKRQVAPPGSDAPAGLASSFFHDQIQAGSVLKVRAPSGHFYLDHGTEPVVLIAGGIGITPMLSMLNWVLAAQPEREIWLFYGVANSDEMLTSAQLEAKAAANQNFHLFLCFSKPASTDINGQTHRVHGRVDLDLLRRTLPLKAFHFYICGPTAMLESLVPALEDWGVPDAHIHYEAFGPASIKRPNAKMLPSADLPSAAADSPVLVTFATSGKQIPWNAAAGNLLNFAEEHGISLNSGCRSGGCGSCQTTIRSGEVAYQQLPDFDPEPGNCLLCVCTPKTSLTLEA